MREKAGDGENGVYASLRTCPRTDLSAVVAVKIILEIAAWLSLLRNRPSGEGIFWIEWPDRPVTFLSGLTGAWRESVGCCSTWLGSLAPYWSGTSLLLLDECRSIHFRHFRPSCPIFCRMYALFFNYLWKMQYEKCQKSKVDKMWGLWNNLWKYGIIYFFLFLIFL